MTSKRIMLLGAGGQIGQALRAEPLPNDWTLAALTRAECDITDHSKLRDAVQSLRPDLVINAAALTSVEICEADEDAAMAANFEGPAALAAQCSANDIPLIHLSTDYVFDGVDGEKPYRPDHPMNPLNTYGHSKMMGEEAVRHELPWSVILRISAVFSAFGNNMLTRALQMINARDELKFVTDQKSCPTYAPGVAKALIAMADAILDGKTNGFGTFHLCGEGPANRFEFVQAIMAAYAPYTDKRPRILPAVSADFPQAAKRPAYSVLDCTKTFDIYGIRQKPWRDGLDQAIQAFMHHYVG